VIILAIWVFNFSSAAQQGAGESLFMTVVDSLALPPGLVRGITWLENGTLVILREIPDSLAARQRRQVLLTYLDSRGNVIREENFTGTLDRGLACDGEFLWSCGDDQEGGSLLYKIHPDSGTVEDAFPTSGHRPTGIAWDGESLWVVDRDSARLDRFDIEEGQVTRSVLTPGYSPYGLAHVGRHTWVTDYGTGRLYRLAGARRRWSGTVDVSSYSHRAREVVLGGDGSSLWLVPVGTSVAYRVRFS
jgi:hypothetical protein